MHVITPSRNRRSEPLFFPLPPNLRPCPLYACGSYLLDTLRALPRAPEFSFNVINLCQFLRPRFVKVANRGFKPPPPDHLEVVGDLLLTQPEVLGKVRLRPAVQIRCGNYGQIRFPLASAAFWSGHRY